MGRPPRFFEAEGIYHLTIHGVDERPIFIDDLDRQSFALRLPRIVRRERWAIFAACLMDTRTRGRSTGGTAAVVRCSSRGTRDTPITDEEHPLSAVEYVHNNPVKAGMVEHPGDWPWSTYAGCPLGQLLAPHVSGV